MQVLLLIPSTENIFVSCAYKVLLQKWKEKKLQNNEHKCLKLNSIEQAI